MSRLRKTYELKKSAEYYLSSIKLLGGRGCIINKKVYGLTVYTVVYSFDDEMIKEKV
jgi:hypothetical protein